MRPEDVYSAKQEAFLHWRLAVSIRRTDPERALEHANQQMALMRRLIARFPDDKGLKQEFGVGLSAAASALLGAGALDRAAEAYSQSIAMREELLRAEPNNVAFQRNLLVSYGNYAALLGVPWLPNLGRPVDARAAAAKAVSLARSMVNEDPQDATARFNLSMSLVRLGSIEPESETESLAILEEAIAIMQPAARANPKSVNLGVNLATAREYAGHRLESLGRKEEAAAQYKASLSGVEPFLGSGNATAITQAIADQEDLALLFASNGDQRNALDYAGRAVADGERHAASKPPDALVGRLAEAYWVLATVHAKFAEPEQARGEAAKALKLWKMVRNSGILTSYRKSMDNAAAMLAPGLTAPNATAETRR
jgi:tetratricopeptide (TPR) repeat protein